MKIFWRLARKLLRWLWKNRELVAVAIDAVDSSNKKSLDDEERRDAFRDQMPKNITDSDRNLAGEIGLKAIKEKW